MKKFKHSNSLKSYIREVEDYPKVGVSFKDISPLLIDSDAFAFAAEGLVQNLPAVKIACVMAVEARGFLFGSILAYSCSTALVLVRKGNKLVPEDSNTIRFKSSNEYSEEWLGFNFGLVDKVLFPRNNGDAILIHDDVCATGGTVLSIYKSLISKGIPGNNIYFSFLIELSFLKGVDLLISHGVDKNNIKSVIKY